MNIVRPNQFKVPFQFGEGRRVEAAALVRDLETVQSVCRKYEPGLGHTFCVRMVFVVNGLYIPMFDLFLTQLDRDRPPIG